MEEVLVTGAAGFIGYHLADRLLGEGARVTGVDNLNSYYDVSLKEARLKLLAEKKSFAFHRIDIEDAERMGGLFEGSRFDTVVHLAAQAGVRYSMENPHSYVYSNLVGFLNVLEGCRRIRRAISCSPRAAPSTARTACSPSRSGITWTTPSRSTRPRRNQTN
jgi:UDP-glucuronate 4-epimerase